MKLTIEQVRHVANLARLSLTADEEQRYQKQLEAILDAVEQLNELDTAGVEPTSHATLVGNLLRADAVHRRLPVEKGLANAPAKVGTAFAVPKIIE